MAQSRGKNLRKLVTLSPELADRLEKFREEVGASSESDAIKVLIEDGFKLRDRPRDLFVRFEAATQRGETIGGIITLAADHPLVDSAFVNGNEATIHLKELIEGNAQRFMFNRTTREWDWQMGEGSFPDDRWYSLKSHATPEKPKRNADLDDEIPF